MTNKTLVHLVEIAVFTAAIVIILAVTSRHESDPCAWNMGDVPLASCALHGGE